MRCRICVVAILMVLCNYRAAFAEEIDPHVQADEYFRQGREALTHGDYNIAILLFRASHTIEPGRGKLLNIALCEEKLGLLMAAMQHFQQVLAQFTLDDTRLATVQAHVTALASRIPHLRVALAAGTPSGAIVTFEGAPFPAAALGTEIAIDPGTYVISVSATGLTERRYNVVIEEGKTVALTAELDKIAPAKPRPRNDAPQPMSNRTQVGAILGGTGLITFTTGGFIGILALIERNAVDKQCPTHQACSPDVQRRASSGESLSIVSALALSAGAIGVGAGMYLVLSSGKSTASTTVGLTVLPDGGRLGIQGAF